MKTLEEARSEYFEGITRPGGTTCPLCGRFGKRYKFKLNSGMARALIELANHAGEWVDNARFRGHTDILTGSLSTLKHWGLVEAREPEGDQKYSGQYRITLKGFEFATGEITVPSHALLYNDECVGFTDKLVTIQDCLGKHFSYHELITS